MSPKKEKEYQDVKKLKEMLNGKFKLDCGHHGARYRIRRRSRMDSQRFKVQLVRSFVWC